VPDQPRFQVLLSGPARRDIAAIVRRSLGEFGVAASLRYEALISQALRDLRSDPERPGSKENFEVMIAGARTYHLDFSRSRVPGAKVKEPRHFLLYRKVSPLVIVVGRILDEGVDLVRHLPEGYGRAGGDEGA
jgi:toxin ParE1/3/4